jgi:microcystin-dependent protein
MYAGDEIPSDFLKCDGSEVSRTEYKALYDVIGDKYGAGDGKNTFNLPNMQTRVPVAGGELSASAPAGAGVTDAELAFKKTSTPSAPLEPEDTESKSKNNKSKDTSSKNKDGKNKNTKSDSDKNKSADKKETKSKNDKDKNSKDKSDKSENKKQSPKSADAAMYFIIKYK